MKSLVKYIGILFIIISCEPNAESEKISISVELDKAVIQQIYNFRNSRNTKSILPFLTVENPSHRYVAAMALASIQDTSSIIDLADLLNDEYEEVRYAATYALGQIKNSKAAPFLTEAFQKDSSRLVQSGILEAIGYCGTEEHLKYICVARPYPMQDSILLEGQASAIYRFALRGIVHREGTTKIMNDFMANSLISGKARFIAANYLARTKGIDLIGYENVLINNVTEEKDPNTLMFLVTALAKSKTKRAQKTLEKIYFEQEDYRVRCNILRGLKYFTYDSVKTLAFEALDDKNLHIRITAAEYLYTKGNDFDASLFFELGNAKESWQVSTVLLAAALKNTSYFKSKTKSFYSQKIISKYKTADNLYEKGALLKALGNHCWNYRFISNEIFKTTDSTKIPEVIYSSGAEALVLLRSATFFGKELGVSKIRISNELNAIFKRCIVDGDLSAQAIVADFFMNKSMNFKNVYPDFAFITEAQSKLSLPSNIETYNILGQAFSFLADKKEYTPVKSNSFTEIDWPLIKALKGKYKIKIQTSAGQITLQLHPEAAPATVTQFIHLAKAKYYNDKPFHRVVPNFVVQGGCSRGDGWSGFDVTVVSEFSNKLRYNKEGCVGMASAGKDTESAQFFITHSPALHLDGRYTIFAEVTEGMDIVHKLQIGDKIESIEIN
jgi:cyclophilin family peptidyl-prolyl cis-trans isomerase